jgi:hypothetical protein
MPNNGECGGLMRWVQHRAKGDVPSAVGNCIMFTVVLVMVACIPMKGVLLVSCREWQQ